MSWLLTYTGKHFDLVDPQPDMIDFVDIAHGLSNECRYAGQCRVFYSVAQHSELASRLVAEEHALEALLHDAAEAYLKDIPQPLKLLLPDYRAIEDRVQRVIRERFGLPSEASPVIKQADRVMLATERRDLMPADSTPWALLAGVTPMEQRIRAMSPAISKMLFLQRMISVVQAG